MDVVYVMEADNGEVKVGVSGTPYARLSKVKAYYGPRRGFDHVRIVGMVPCPHPLAVEWGAAQELEPHAVGGEWYRLDAMQALVAVLWAALAFDEAACVRWPERPKPFRPRPKP